LSKINNEEKKKNIKKEYLYLNDLIEFKIDKNLYQTLKDININIWLREEKIRIKEKNKDFDNEFIEIARTIYKLNDERAKIKKEINIKYDSEIIEEKSYE